MKEGLRGVREAGYVDGLDDDDKFGQRRRLTLILQSACLTSDALFRFEISSAPPATSHRHMWMINILLTWDLIGYMVLHYQIAMTSNWKCHHLQTPQIEILLTQTQTLALASIGAYSLTSVRGAVSTFNYEYSPASNSSTALVWEMIA